LKDVFLQSGNWHRASTSSIGRRNHLPIDLPKIATVARITVPIAIIPVCGCNWFAHKSSVGKQNPTSLFEKWGLVIKLMVTSIGLSVGY
jgi:hypothetical protein